MQNEEGERVDLYIPRKCSYTNRLIGAKDVSSVQINVGQTENGVYNGQYVTFALCGFIRARGDGDHAMNTLAVEKGLLKPEVMKTTL